MHTNVTVPVVIYTSALCGYCLMAKRLLAGKGVAFEQRLVDGDPVLRAEMVARSGLTSVPQIFIGRRHVGGCDELYALARNGHLDALLAGTGVPAP